MVTEPIRKHCENILQIFGHNVRRVREKQQYSYLDLERLSGYSRQYISSLELGEKDIQLSTAVKIARALNTPFPKLFSRSFDIDISVLREEFRDDDFLLVFSTNVRKHLAAVGKKEIHIYMETGMDTATINRTLNKRTSDPRISSLAKIAAGVGLDLNDLLNRT